MQSYFETSALTKILLEETDAPEADDLWHAAEAVFSSRVTYVEARAAIAAARRDRRVDAEAARRARHQLERRWAEVHVIDVTAELTRRAGDLAEQHALRGMDAIHLASLLAVGPGVAIVSWDRALATAARDRGLATGGIPA